jgi:hypothetical protein
MGVRVTYVGRDLGRGAKRSRPAPPDALPQPRAVRREVREAVARLHALDLVYALEHEALVALGSSEVSVTSSPGSLTEGTVLDKENEAARRRCARAVAHLRSASTHVELALGAFGSLAEQPERSPDAVVDQSTFERAVNRRRHREREEELRR